MVNSEEVFANGDEGFQGWLDGVQALVIEYDNNDAQRYQQWLEEAGATVARARTVHEAQEVLAHRNDIRLAVSSAFLPDGSGLTVARRLATASNESRSIITSDVSHAALITAVRKIPGCCYLSKRADRGDLIFNATRSVEIPSLTSFILYSCRQWGLSPQQAKIVSYSLWGHSDREIAEALGISVRTVQEYQFLIRKKTGVRSKSGYFRLLLQSLGARAPHHDAAAAARELDSVVRRISARSLGAIS